MFIVKYLIRQSNFEANYFHLLILVFSPTPLWLHQAMVLRVSRLPLIADGRVRSQASSCEICGVRSDDGTGFSTNTLVYPCRRHTTIFLYLHFTHLPLTTYNVSKLLSLYKIRSLNVLKTTRLQIACTFIDVFTFC